MAGSLAVFLSLSACTQSLKTKLVLNTTKKLQRTHVHKSHSINQRTQVHTREEESNVYLEISAIYLES